MTKKIKIDSEEKENLILETIHNKTMTIIKLLEIDIKVFRLYRKK